MSKASEAISEVRDVVEILGEVVSWVVKAVGAFIAGGESRHLIDVLPEKLRADVEHLRQRTLLKKELEEKLKAKLEG